jgi:hypothetical protein
MKSTMKKLTLALIWLTLLIGTNNVPSKAADKSTSAVGQWQYVVRRADTKGPGGAMHAPLSCPFYVGYFSLDFKQPKKHKDGFWMEPTDIQAMTKDGKTYVMGANSYEVIGSYTPEDINTLCDTPNTKTHGPRVPLYMKRVSSNGEILEWFTEFKEDNVIWSTKAQYNKDKEEINGTIKTYICRGEGTEKRCNNLSTSKFVAKRIKSIEEASGLPLFAKEASLSTWFRWISGKFNKDNNDGSIQRFAKSTDDYRQGLKSNYVRPNISAIMPAFADLRSEKCADGGCVQCATDNCSGRCVYVNCPGKDGQPAPTTQADLYDAKTPAYAGNCGGGRSSYDGKTCL